MRFVTFAPSPGAQPRFGELVDDGRRLLDLSSAAEAAGLRAPTDFLEWFDLDGRLLPAVRSRTSAWEQEPGLLRTRDSVRLLAPVPRPGKVVCIGLNYRDHAAEQNVAPPKSPIVFSKFQTSITGPEAPIRLGTSMKLDWEAELAVVIGRRAKGLSKERAYEAVLGYACFNDVSARDFQFADGQWQRGKSGDTHGPLGPFIATADDVPDPHALAIRLRLNGQLMQDSRTSEMIFRVPELIEFISENITLEPGDVIATGTPPGVGFARKPPVYLKAGDVTEVEIEGLGILRNSVTS
jgi:2-keto-4-pentenoate hydratase/2-oxohepta-3-ene-1,7-dioic acid hydratase in catechol pathway